MVLPRFSREVRVGVFFLCLVIAVLVYLKWSGAYVKYQAASTSHTMTESLYLTGGPLWQQPFLFTAKYLRDIWWATLLGLLGGGAVIAFFPFGIFRKSLQGEGLRQCLVGTLVATPLMICACCSSLVVPSLRKKGVGIGPSLSFWIASPSLHLGGIAIIATLFSWQAALFRLLLAFGTSVLVAAFIGARASCSLQSPPLESTNSLDLPVSSSPIFALRWVETTLRLAGKLLPIAVGATLVVGVVKTYLFPGPLPMLQDAGLLQLLMVSLLGTLMMVPTLGEIPLVLGLAQLGLSQSSAAVLLYSLPAVNFPSLLIVGRYLGWKVASAVGIAVTGIGFAGGLVWQVLFS
ncbi:MAG: hypothetical protein A2W73_10905 [Deltaproteobacteria bacterium RIFCSPLOWO2_12_55_13]|nr:MAG: hypothetical protein A2W73_10905 [Deltaproteobacteria bacterium RIFCSPLOWO2_12_55_13]